MAVITRGHFFKLWFSQILSLTAQHLLNFALIIAVFDLAKGTRFANIAIALVILAFGIPGVLFSAPAGVYADFWDRKKVLVVSNFLRTILVLAYLLVDTNLSLILLLTLLVSTATQFFAPAEISSIPKLVSRNHLVEANALFVFTSYATFVVGYSVAAPIIKLFGDQAPFVFAASLFGVATVLTLLLPKLGHDRPAEASHKKLLADMVRELNENRRLILSNINLYFPMAQLMLIQTMVSVLLTLAPALSESLLKLPLKEASHILVIPAGLGMVIGVVVIKQIAERISKLKLIIGGLAVAGTGLALLGLTGQLYRTFNGVALASTAKISVITAILILVFGMVNSIISISAQTLMQENTADEVRGKVFGTLNMMINLAASAPVLLAGVLADVLSVTKVIAITGILVLMVALFEVWSVRQHKSGKLVKTDIISG